MPPRRCRRHAATSSNRTAARAPLTTRQGSAAAPWPPLPRGELRRRGGARRRRAGVGLVDAGRDPDAELGARDRGDADDERCADTEVPERALPERSRPRPSARSRAATSPRPRPGRARARRASGRTGSRRRRRTCRRGHRPRSRATAPRRSSRRSSGEQPDADGDEQPANASVSARPETRCWSRVPTTAPAIAGMPDERGVADVDLAARGVERDAGGRRDEDRAERRRGGDVRAGTRRARRAAGRRSSRRRRRRRVENTPATRPIEDEARRHRRHLRSAPLVS